MNYEKEIATNNDVSKRALSLEDTLKQMRERRYSSMNKSSQNRDDEALPMPKLAKTSSTFSQASEDESEQRIYWRRLGRNKRSNEALPMPMNNQSPSSVTSVTQFVEKEFISKLEGLLDLSSKSSPSPIIKDASNNKNYNHNSSRHRQRQTADQRFGRYHDQAMQLDYTPQDLEELVGGSDFQRLKRTLRNRGAVTNEMLRQVLPMVVKQSRQEKQQILARSLQ